MVSIIIPSYNSESTIAECLDALLAQDFQGEYEITLVDSSNDNTPNIVTAKYPKVKLIHLPNKTDPGTARNLGIAEAKGDLIAFIDSDCIAAPDWLENIVAAHTSSPYNIIGGVVKNGNDKRNLVAWAGYIAEFREFIPGQPRREVSHIPTCNLSYKKRVFYDFGLFEGEYYPQEDLVYNFKLSQQGEKILLEPKIQVFHNHRTKLKDFLLHQKRIGTVTSKVLKIVPLSGSFIARNPFLAFFLLPFLPLIKFFRTFFVFLKHQPDIITKRFFAFFIFALGLLLWVSGFAQGVYEKSPLQHK